MEKEMKSIIALISVIQSFIGVPVALNLIANDNKVLGFICLAWFGLVILLVGEWLIRQVRRVKVFTLMELLAVITIMSILLTVAMRAMKIDPQKSDAIILSSELKSLHSQSFIYDNDTGYEREFIIDEDKFISEIVPSHPNMSFNKGAPSELGYSIEVKYKDLKPITIRVTPFTGKVKFYKYD